MDIRSQTTGSKEKRQRLINRTNTKYETVTLTNGRKLTRRNPNIPFKPPRKKPENGATRKNAKGNQNYGPSVWRKTLTLLL